MKVGILGGGQLGRMLALAGYPLGLDFRVLEPATETAVGGLADVRVLPFDSERQELAAFADGLSVVTYEFENVPAATVRTLAELVPTFPPADILDVAQDRLREKQTFVELGIPTNGFRAVDSLEELRSAAQHLGLPAVLKTRRGGYDGKGQAVLRNSDDLTAAWSELGNRPLILESFVRFEQEVSIVAVRSVNGETAFYPLIENRHANGILQTSRAPAPSWTPSLQDEAEGHARKILEKFGYVGVLAIEFFVHRGKLVANEMAPRVHNSGHWTIEGAATSQFENHWRALLGWPLGSTEAIGHSLMLNLIGTFPDLRPLAAEPDVHIHLYGKSPRPGRKIGHVTIRRFDEDALSEFASAE